MKYLSIIILLPSCSIIKERNERKMIKEIILRDSQEMIEEYKKNPYLLEAAKELAKTN